MKLRLYFLKTILDQENSSLISKFFHLQLRNGTKFDWAITCLNNLKELNLTISLKDIKEMTRKQYREMIKTKCDELAFKYLMNKRRTKGKEIEYTRVQMSDYLLSNYQSEIEDQKQIFELRNKMTNIRTNKIELN